MTLLGAGFGSSAPWQWHWRVYAWSQMSQALVLGLSFIYPCLWIWSWIHWLFVCMCVWKFNKIMNIKCLACGKKSVNIYCFNYYICLAQNLPGYRYLMNIGLPNIRMLFSFLFVLLFWKILSNFGSSIWLLCLFIEWHLLFSG